MRTLAFVSEKGGSGKSTLAVHLSVLAEEEGETVCIIDMDPQANAVAWHEVRGTNEPNVFAGTPDQLPKMLDAAATLSITLAIVDTPSKVDEAALAAIRAADLIIAPTRAGLFDVAALRDTVRLLEMAEQMPFAIAVINDFDVAKRKATISEATAVLESFGIPISPVHIPNRPPLETVLKRGKGITEAQPKSVAAEEIRALWLHITKLHKGVAPSEEEGRIMNKHNHTKPDRNLLATAMSKITGRAPTAPAKASDIIGYPTPPSRITRKAITTWQDAVAVQQLKDIAGERRVSQQKLIAEALNMVFAKYGRPPIAT